eukprot:COSAG05_NODE_980_length_6311_cov_21.873632_1_plen_83_part_00
MGTVLRKSIPINFQYDPQSAHLHDLPNGFRRLCPLDSAFAVESDLKYFRRKIYRAPRPFLRQKDPTDFLLYSTVLQNLHVGS